MARPLNRNQQLENAAFLKQLRLSGNVRLAARAIGKAYSTMQHRRGAYPPFATEWAIAVASANARLARNGGQRGPESRAPGPDGAHRTTGGEPVVVQLKNGKLQVRAAQPGKLTKQCEQAFLLALSATCNVRLAAAAAGACEGAFYRRRHRNPGFAREMRMAMEEGWQRLNEALLAGFLPEAHLDDAWRHNDAPDMPQMTPDQALQLMYLHQKEAAPKWNVAIARGLKWGETAEQRRGEVQREYAEKMKRMAEDNVRATLDGLAARLGASPHETPVVLPDLNQVAVSRADPEKAPHHPGRALFGGWRSADLSADDRARAKAECAVSRRRGRRRRGPSRE